MQLSNISFEPRNELGRLIYDLNMTVTEVADGTSLFNYNSLNIAQLTPITLTTIVPQ